MKNLYLLFIFLFPLPISSFELRENQETIESVSKVMIDVIQKFYIANDIKFDFIIYGEATPHIQDIITEVTKVINNEISITIKHVKDVESWNHKLSQSAIFLTKSKDLLFLLHTESMNSATKGQKLINNTPKDFKFVHYVGESLSFEQLEGFIDAPSQYMSYTFSDLRFFEFFITNDKNFVNLSAPLMFTEEKCNQLKPKILNSFNKSLQNWEKNLENFNHFENFHNCMLTFLVDYNYFWYANEIGIKTFEEYKNAIAHEKLQYRGLTNEIVKATAKRANFTSHFSILDRTKKANEITGIKNFKGSIHNFIMLFNSQMDRTHLTISYSDPCGSIDYYYLVTPNDLYTNYEKLLMPFDVTTWILLMTVIISTFCFIFAFRSSSQNVKNFVYGKGMRDSGFNALSIIFGMSQLKLPSETIQRSVLLLFIWFCLMFRTCYQSMLFEFMTSDMRKPLPASIEDTIKYNYTVVLLESRAHEYFRAHIEILNGRERPSYFNISVENFLSLYNGSIGRDYEKKLAFLVRTDYHASLNSSFKTSLTIMENERLTKITGYVIGSNNILLSHLNQVINHLIPSGIIKYLADFAIWHLYRPFDVQEEDPRRILSMFDLEFGFVLWIVSLSLPITCFLCEIFSIKSNSINVFGKFLIPVKKNFVIVILRSFLNARKGKF